MNIKNHNIAVLAIGISLTISLPVFSQQQNPQDKKGNDKTAGAHQAAPQHQNAPQHQAVHQNAPQQPAVHQNAPQSHAAPQQQVSHQNAQQQQQQAFHQNVPQKHVASQQQVALQNAPQQQGALIGGGRANNNPKHQSQFSSNGNGQLSSRSSGGASRATYQSTFPVNSQTVQSGNGGRKQRNQAQSFSNQQGSYASGNNVQQAAKPYAQNGGGNQGRQPQVSPNGQYNSGNNYGGYWSSGNTHNDWNHSGQHYWNNNNYVWYQGGWLIVNSFFNPYYANSGYANNGYANNGYYNNGSLVSQVQTSLANLGYYNGPIDGDAGSGTRNAIASYQNNQNLNVTGHINGDLLQSLQIQ